MKKNESTRPWKSLHHRVSGRDDYGQYYDLAAALVDGPKTLQQIEGHYQSYLRLLGIPVISEQSSLPSITTFILG